MLLNSGEISNGILNISRDSVVAVIGRKFSQYDKKGENHYNIISALHKSMRNSNVDASLYWLARMLEAGDDPLYIARRIVRFASEDIGLASNMALHTTIAAYQACMYLGMPECGVHLAHAVIYCALSPKSNSVYKAYDSASEDAKKFPNEPVPLQIRNAVTNLMKEIGYGEGYMYAHDFKEGITNMKCMPDKLLGKIYYTPTKHGQEAKLEEWIKSKQEHNNGGS
jgi:putative ATPase